MRCNKLDLGVVRDYCHEICRKDTFNSSKKIRVHNYDGSFDYHPIHLRNQSLKEYYKLLAKLATYAIWQNENKKVDKNRYLIVGFFLLHFYQLSYFHFAILHM